MRSVHLRYGIAVAATVAAVFAGVVVQADVVEDARDSKRPFIHKNARVGDLAEGKVTFVGDNGLQQRIELASIRRVELSVRTEKDFNEAERAYAEGSDVAAAVKHYEAALKSPGGPTWKAKFIHARMVLLQAKAGNPDGLVKSFLALYAISPKDAENLLPGEVPAGNPNSHKVLRDAINAAQARKADTVALIKLLDKMGGGGATTKTDTPVAKVDPGVTPKTGTGTPSTKVGPAGSVPVDLVAGLVVASKETIAMIVTHYGGGKGRVREAADLFLRTELDVSTDDAEAEKYLVTGGMACVDTAKELQKKIEDLKTEALTKTGEERSKLLKEADDLEPRRVRYLMQGAIALAASLELSTATDKRFAPPCYWSAWAHEQLNRPLRARALYAHFVATYSNGAPADLLGQAKAAIERLSEGG